MAGAPTLGQYVVRVPLFRLEVELYPLWICAHFLSFSHFNSGGRSKILKIVFLKIGLLYVAFLCQNLDFARFQIILYVCSGRLSVPGLIKSILEL